jgi:hypothetical protein
MEYVYSLATCYIRVDLGGVFVIHDVLVVIFNFEYLPA